MTRLTPSDLLPLLHSSVPVVSGLVASTGRSLSEIAAAAAGLASAKSFDKASAAVVPVTAGQGVIPGFTETVVAILRSLGVAAETTSRGDVGGLAQAFDRHPDAVFLADDNAFVAFDPNGGSHADNGVATGRGFAQALHEAAGGVFGRRVLVVGLGPVGTAAAGHLLRLGADVLAVEVASERVDQAVRELRHLRPVELDEGLEMCDLVVDASPVAGIIPNEWARPGCYVAAPGMPLGLSAETAERLGCRLIHEPLAIGVAVMLASLLAAREAGVHELRPSRPTIHTDDVLTQAEGR